MVDGVSGGQQFGCKDNNCDPQGPKNYGYRRG